MKTGWQVILAAIILIWVLFWFGIEWAAIGYLLVGLFNFIFLDEAVEAAVDLNLDPEATKFRDNQPNLWLVCKLCVLVFVWPKQYFHVC